MNQETHRGLSASRRRVGALGIFAAACAAMFVGAGAVYADTSASGSSSAPAPSTSDTGSAPAPSAYPPAENCALQGQPSSVVPGATVTITGLAAASTTVSAVLSPQASTIGTASSDTTGKYSIAATVPVTAANGNTITVGGVTCATVVVATPTTPAPPVGSNAVTPIIATPAPSSSLEATSASGSASAPSSAAPSKVAQLVQTHSSKPLAFTGASVLVPGVLGLAFIGGGVILFVLGRRGKARQH